MKKRYLSKPMSLLFVITFSFNTLSIARTGYTSSVNTDSKPKTITTTTSKPNQTNKAFSNAAKTNAGREAYKTYLNKTETGSSQTNSNLTNNEDNLKVRGRTGSQIESGKNKLKVLSQTDAAFSDTAKKNEARKALNQRNEKIKTDKIKNITTTPSVESVNVPLPQPAYGQQRPLTKAEKELIQKNRQLDLQNQQLQIERKQAGEQIARENQERENKERKELNEKVLKLGKIYGTYYLNNKSQKIAAVISFLDRLNSQIKQVDIPSLNSIESRPNFTSFVNEAKEEGRKKGANDAFVQAKQNAKIDSDKLAEDSLLADLDSKDSLPKFISSEVHYQGANSGKQLYDFKEYISTQWNYSNIKLTTSQNVAINSEFIKKALDGKINETEIIKKLLNLEYLNYFVVQEYHDDLNNYSPTNNSKESLLFDKDNQFFDDSELKDQFVTGFTQSIKNNYSSFKNTDKQAMQEADDIIESLRMDWIERVVIPFEAYKKTFKNESLITFKEVYAQTYRDELSKSQEAINKSYKLKFKDPKFFFNGISSLENNKVGIGDIIGISAIGMNSGGQPFHGPVLLKGIPVLPSSETPVIFDIYAKSKTNLEIQNLGFVTAGSLDQILINEDYEISLNIGNFTDSTKVTIDWERTLMNLGRPENSLETRTEILNFIQQKLTKEWNLLTDNWPHALSGFTLKYNRYNPEAGGNQSLLGSIPHILKMHKSICELTNHEELMKKIEAAIPKVQPLFKLKYNDWDWAMKYINDIRGTLDRNCQN